MNWVQWAGRSSSPGRQMIPVRGGLSVPDKSKQEQKPFTNQTNRIISNEHWIYKSGSPVLLSSVHLKIEVGWTSNFDFLFQGYNIHCWGTALFPKVIYKRKSAKKIIKYSDEYDYHSVLWPSNTMTVPQYFFLRVNAMKNPREVFKQAIIHWQFISRGEHPKLWSS